MGHAQKRLAAGFTELCQAVNVSPLPFLNMGDAECQGEIVKVLEKVSQLPDDKWASLPEPAQKLFDSAAEVVNNNQSPANLCIETVANGQDKAAGAAAIGRQRKAEKEGTAPAEKPAPAAKAPPKETPVVAQSSGETKAATEASKMQPGRAGGNRKNPATDWCRVYCIDHPEQNADAVLKACLEQNFAIPISKGTVDTLVYEMRNCLRILREKGMLKA